MKGPNKVLYLKLVLTWSHILGQDEKCILIKHLGTCFLSGLITLPKFISTLNLLQKNGCYFNRSMTGKKLQISKS